MEKPTNKTHPARLSQMAYEFFVAEISPRKLARVKPDTIMGMIDELIEAEKARRKDESK